MFYDAVPGNNPAYPLGWWGWADQSHYLEAANDFLSFHVSADKHIYPPLYPLLGSVFLSNSALHSYALINLILYCIYVSVFMIVFSQFIGRWLSLIAIVIGTFIYPILTLQWVIPWTSTLSATLAMLALFFFNRFLLNRTTAQWTNGERYLNASLCGLSVGLIAPTRPIDFLTFSIVPLLYAVLDIKDSLSRSSINKSGSAAVVFIGGLSLVLPFLFYLGFNSLVFGHPFGGYFAQIKGAGGMRWTDLVDKAYSNLIDAGAYYAQPDADWLTTLPLLLFGLCFVPVVLIRGPTFLRVCCLVAIVHFSLVYSYADAVATNQFLYFNVHYFKWLYPVLIALPLSCAHDMFRSSRARRIASFGSIIAGAMLFMLLASLKPHYSVHRMLSIVADSADSFTIRFPGFTRVDFIDLAQINLPTTQINQRVQGVSVTERSGRRQLKPITDMRVVPRTGGTRIVLADRLEINEIQIKLIGFGDLTQIAHPQAIAITAQLGLGTPLSKQTPDPEFTTEYNKVYYTNATGQGRQMLGDGWSTPEDWGTWMDGDFATLELNMPEPVGSGTSLVITGQAFVSDPGQSYVTLSVVINAKIVNEFKLTGTQRQLLRIDIPDFGSEQPDSLDIEFRPVSTLSPALAGLNTDARELSFGIISVEVEE